MYKIQKEKGLYILKPMGLYGVIMGLYILKDLCRYVLCNKLRMRPTLSATRHLEIISLARYTKPYVPLPNGLPIWNLSRDHFFLDEHTKKVHPFLDGHTIL